MAMCVVCERPTTSNLCDSCAEDLDVPLPFVPEQILSAWSRASDAALIDTWGRPHHLEVRTQVGRIPVSRGISIFDASVSRRHAELVRGSDGRWTVIDLGSVNGTRVNDSATNQAVLEHGARLAFGTVGFYFTDRVSLLVEDAVDPSASRTLRRSGADKVALRIPTPPKDEVTFTGMPTIAFQLMEAPSGGGGYLSIAGKQMQLTDTQFELVRMLARRVANETEVPQILRGFVPSGQLIAELPWDSTNPTENHLKQLVRRVRKMLDDVDLGTLIESRRGFGYRLRAIPRAPFETTA